MYRLDVTNNNPRIIDRSQWNGIFKSNLCWNLGIESAVVNMQMSSGLIEGVCSWNGNGSTAIVGAGHDTLRHHVRISVGLKVEVARLLASLRHPDDVQRRQEGPRCGNVPVGPRWRRLPVSRQFEASFEYETVSFLHTSWRFQQNQTEQKINCLDFFSSFFDDFPHFLFLFCPFFCDSVGSFFWTLQSQDLISKPLFSVGIIMETAAIKDISFQPINITHNWPCSFVINCADASSHDRNWKSEIFVFLLFGNVQASGG